MKKLFSIRLKSSLAAIITFIGVGLCLCVGAHAQSARPKSALTTDTLSEGFAFYLKDFKLEHQEETHLLNITVRYDYIRGIGEKEYPDFVPMVKFVENFLTDYPNKNTYWEIVNKQLTQRLLAEYPGLATVTCELQVPPSRRFNFMRASFVTRERRTNRQRAFKASKEKARQ